MKKIVSVLLSVLILSSLCAIGSFAATSSKTATWSLKASVMNADSNQANDKKNYINSANKVVYNSKDNPTVCVYPGQVVWVTMHLETGSKYYAGDLAGFIFYTNNIFKSTDQSSSCYVWNEEGPYSSVAEQVGAPYSKIVDSLKKNNYPSVWTDFQKSSHEYYTVVTFPDANKTTQTVSNVDEDLVTVPIYVKSNAKVGLTGSIYIPQELVRTVDSPNEKFFLSNYEDNGDLLGKNTPYSKNTENNVSQAKLNFLVCDKNAKSINVSQKNLDLNYKDKTLLSATVQGVSNPTVIWSSSNPKVVAVDENGNVTATGRGNATITATYGNYSATCDVTVSFTFGQWLIYILLFGFIWY